MTDRVFIRHPDHPDRNGYVSRTAFDNLWSRKGYVTDEDDEPPPDTTATGPEGQLETSSAGGGDADSSRALTPEGLNADLDEKAQLRDQLEGLGINVDLRWGIKRLRTELATATEATTDA